MADTKSCWRDIEYNFVIRDFRGTSKTTMVQLITK